MYEIWDKYNNILLEGLFFLQKNAEIIFLTITIIILGLLVILGFVVWMSSIIKREIGFLPLASILPLIGVLTIQLKKENEKYWLAIGMTLFFGLFISVLIAKVISYYLCKLQI